jgi:hypothetical protein
VGAGAEFGSADGASAIGPRVSVLARVTQHVWLGPVVWFAVTTARPSLNCPDNGGCGPSFAEHAFGALLEGRYRFAPESHTSAWLALDAGLAALYTTYDPPVTTGAAAGPAAGPSAGVEFRVSPAFALEAGIHAWLTWLPPQGVSADRRALGDNIGAWLGLLAGP